MSGSSSRSIARRSVARTRSTTLRFSGRSLSRAAHDRGWPLRLNGTQAELGDRPRQLRLRRVCAFAPRLYGVASAISADQTRCRAAAARVALGGPEHGGEARQERTGDLRCPARTSLQLRSELIGQPGDHLRIRHVLVEHLDRGAVAVTVDLAAAPPQRRRHPVARVRLSSPPARSTQGNTAPARCPVVMRSRRRSRLSSSNHAAAARNWAPWPTIRSCIATADVGVDERRRVLRVRPQPQHQRVDDPLDGAT